MPLPRPFFPPELITRRVIVGILIMILLIPAFDIRLGTFGRARTVAESGLKMLHAMAAAEGRNTSSFGAALGVREWWGETRKQ